ncbi:response regulator [Sphingomonas sp.]|uniref:response regulator n=1 Tax=Sphingomonas sp. TaxID=28214 RepID=UPI002C9334C9|nr:response regulator [Sphingomonas sp.]HWK35319.1 response regulator [Sphingomonas sp.]
MSQSQRILIVEDEPLIAMMLEDFLDALGKRAAGTADTVATALAAVEAGGFDGAIVDVHLRGGEVSWPVADALDAAGLPFVIVTGGSNDSIVDRHRDRPALAKPFTMESVQQVLADLQAEAGEA